MKKTTLRARVLIEDRLETYKLLLATSLTETDIRIAYNKFITYLSALYDYEVLMQEEYDEYRIQAMSLKYVRLEVLNK